jgi:disulfide bond formation protein DsbB
VRAERDRQLKHFEALDTKAGIVLGFAGALVALTPRHVNALLVIGRIGAVLSAFLGLSTFWPRDVWSEEVPELRARYLAADLAFTKLRLLDTLVNAATATRAVVRSKAFRLKLAMIALAVAILSVGSGAAIQ